MAENYKYLLCKHGFSHLDFYSDIGNIIDKIPLASMDDSITHTDKKLWDHINTCIIVSTTIIHALRGELCVKWESLCLKSNCSTYLTIAQIFNCYS